MFHRELMPDSRPNEKGTEFRRLLSTISRPNGKINEFHRELMPNSRSNGIIIEFRRELVSDSRLNGKGTELRQLLWDSRPISNITTIVANQCRPIKKKMQSSSTTLFCIFISPVITLSIPFLLLRQRKCDQHNLHMLLLSGLRPLRERVVLYPMGEREFVHCHSFRIPLAQ